MANVNDLNNGQSNESSSFPFESYVANQQPLQRDPRDIAREEQVAHAQAHAKEEAERIAQIMEEGNISPNPTVRPVTLGAGMAAPAVSSVVTSEDVEAVSAYKTLEARRKKKRRRNIIIGCVLGALALTGVGAFASSQLSPEQPETGESVDIGFAVIEDFENSISASGAITPASQIVVVPEVDGKIDEINVAEGDKVLKGDVLFTIKNDDLDKAITEAERALETANNNVTSQQNSVNTAYSNYSSAVDNYNKVFSTGYETQEIADAAGQQATETLEAADKAYEDAQRALEEAQEEVTKAEEKVESAKETATKRTVRAPEAGDIINMNAKVGSLVGSGSTGEGSSGSLITIADLSTLHVSVQVNEVDINQLAEGQDAEITFSALPEVTAKAKVEHVASVANNADGGMGGVVTYNVDLVIDSPDPQIKPGMTARVKILTEHIAHAITVPNAALKMMGEEDALVMVAPNYAGEENPEFEERKVKVVATDGVSSVVEGKLADGDAVQLFFDASFTDEDEPVIEVAVG